MSTVPMRIVDRVVNTEVAAQLQAAGVPALLARLYASRGVLSATELATGVAGLPPFTQMKGAEAAGQCLAAAITARARILVVGDYDADGATATALAMRGLVALGAKVDFLVPNRFEYGYGLTPEIVTLAATRHPALIVTVDNGIASIAGVAAAHALGIRVLITDHHLPGDTLPDAEVIVNPNQPGCTFPSKALAGVGVMFYVLLATRAALRAQGAFTDRPEPNVAQWLDYVALGTVADVVRLDGVNRILVAQGLARIRAGQASPGIRALFQVAKRDTDLASAGDLGFSIGPRLNAAGRLDDMSFGIQTLLADDMDHAVTLATELDALNAARRDIEGGMVAEALAHLPSLDPSQRYTLCLFDPNWHQGVVGLVASRVRERCHRPTLVFALGEDGFLKGSGRSIVGFHLRDALDLVAKRLPHVLSKFGGHAAAAGLTLAPDDLPLFIDTFEAVARTLLRPEDLAAEIETDGELDASNFTQASAEALAAQVWGQGFPAPRFRGRFKVVAQRILGSGHLKLRLELEGMRGTEIEAMWFRRTETIVGTLHCVYQLSLNHYQGITRLQLLIEHEIEHEIEQ